MNLVMRERLMCRYSDWEHIPAQQALVRLRPPLDTGEGVLGWLARSPSCDGADVARSTRLLDRRTLAWRTAALWNEDRSAYGWFASLLARLPAPGSGRLEARTSVLSRSVSRTSVLVKHPVGPFIPRRQDRGFLARSCNLAHFSVV